MKPFPYIMTDQSITVVINNIPHTINSDHPNFAMVKGNIRNEEWKYIESNLSIGIAMAEYTREAVVVNAEGVFYNDRVMHGVMVNRLLDMYRENYDITPFIAFYSNLLDNPSKTAIDELYLFLEAGQFPITEDGCFMAYKKVRADYLDIWSSTMDNSPGQTVEMLRCEVDDNREVACSDGLHFCALNYLEVYGDNPDYRTVIVKVNPRDVVSIPRDYDNAKARCCKYVVVADLTDDNITKFEKPVVNIDIDNSYDIDTGMFTPKQLFALSYIKTALFNHVGLTDLTVVQLNELKDTYPVAYEKSIELIIDNMGIVRSTAVEYFRLWKTIQSAGYNIF